MKLRGRALEQLAGAYALGILGSRTKRRFESQMLRDIELRRAWQQWEKRLPELAPELPPVRPPDRSWQAIERRLQQKRPARARSPVRWLVAAALVTGIALAVWWGQLRP